MTTVRRPWQRRWQTTSPFVAAAACEALTAAGADAAPFAAYLRETREPDGSWMFDPAGRRWPPDADTTSCAVAALADGAAIVRRIAETQPDPASGLVRPWLLWYDASSERLDRNAADAIVTANVVFAAQRVGVDTSPLRDALARAHDTAPTVYYDSPALRAYYFARAGVGTEPVAGRFDGVDAAAALATAALLGQPSGGLRERVVGMQQRDGTWPAARWFVDPARYVWQSRTFSTALAVEALALAAGR